MTTRPIHHTAVVCDACGRQQEGLLLDATSARLAAARDGWKYTKYDRRLRQPKAHQYGPRVFDSCPDCPLPETPEEAQRLIDRRAES